MTHASTRHAVVIGAGLGGLAAALRLRLAGWEVAVCEHGPRPGGKMNRLEQDGYRFDTGPSLITMPWIFGDLFEAAGERIGDHLELMPVRPLADYAWPDGARLRFTANVPELMEGLHAIDARDARNFFPFMELGARLFELSAGTFLRTAPTEPPDMAALRALRHFPFRGAWGNYHKTVARYFRSPYLQQLFNRYPTYVGSSPYECPATLLLIPYLEFAFGGWYVKGGLYAIVEALVKLLEARGVDIRLNATAELITRADGRVSGVALADGTQLPAQAVVMNGDASHAGPMLGDPKRVESPPRERSMSGFVMLVGLRRKLPEVHHHTVYFSEDYRTEFRQLFDERRFPEDPTVYVNVPSRSDPDCAPAHGETLFIMANAPADAEPWDDAQTHAAKASVLSRLSASGFDIAPPDIETEFIWTPRRMAERYRMPGGAIYGTHSHGWKKAFLRPPNKDRKVGGLYYVGGSTHPGGGTPIVLRSAEITARLIARHEGNN